ncbi:PKD-like domain-containing protein [Empedobacter falsenii]|uniref:PKD-like domain-containing protein n=1 Tax=Empedobacter TaxID=59734 RepID=UPI0025762EA3|nr:MULTISPECIES: PKD-like domain-containing protein [Empedobacter]MDM1041724.1 cell surface protein [Empedobacter brevis]MDM1135142.1 cell surface protein [Empedobacter sp. R750]
MKYSKILLTALSFALIQSCSDDENIIETNPDNATLQASYDAARLKIVSIEPTVSGFENATYTWKLGNEIIGNQKTLGFVSDEVGSYDLTLEITSGATSKTIKTKVNVTQELSTYSKYISQVFDYLPAVGQFTNALPAYVTGETQADMTAKAAKALVGEKSTMITLGGYGGYVVFGFDHTIMNQPNKRDFKVLGNGFAGSSEPGIVMVAYDKNKNGKPDDDEWYEIAGSEYTNPNTIKNYTITYTKPDENKTPVKGTIGWQTDIEYIKWSDNQGNSGYKTKNSYHKQSYYPLWFGSDQLKFTGTLLESNYTEKNGIWTGKQYAYGYVDNAPNNSEDSNIDIDWAVDKNGNPVKLMGIDFIKVYTATNQEAGWLGEISTEVAGAYDLHL